MEHQQQQANRVSQVEDAMDILTRGQATEVWDRARDLHTAPHSELSFLQALEGALVERARDCGADPSESPEQRAARISRENVERYGALTRLDSEQLPRHTDSPAMSINSDRWEAEQRASWPPRC